MNWGAFGAALVGLFNRLVDIVDDIVNTRAIIAFLTVGGFYYILDKVIDKLVNPPASELFTIVNIALALPLSAASFYFGFKEGQNNPPKPPDEG